VSNSPNDPIRQTLNTRPGALTLAHQIRQLRRLVQLALEREDVVAAAHLKEMTAVAEHRLRLMRDDRGQDSSLA
jgi:hypothetical protein